MSTKYLLTFLFIPIIFNLWAQQPKVNHVNGSLTMSRNLHNVVLESKSFPINANYYTSGMRVGDRGGFIGLGWDLSIVGTISRSVQGEPDIALRHNYYSGWLINNQFNEVDDRIQQYYDTEEECLNINIVQTVHSSTDLQSDKYHLNFGQLKGTFLFDEEGVPYFTEYNGLFIEPIEMELNADGSIIYNDWPSAEVCDDEDESDLNDCKGGKDIYAFRVTDEQGFQYIFSKSTIVEKKVDIIESNYISTWYISRVISPAGEEMKFIYNEMDANSKVFESTSYSLKYIKSGNEYVTSVSSAPTIEKYSPLFLKEIQVFKANINSGYTERLVFESEPISDINFSSARKLKLDQNKLVNNIDELAQLQDLKIYKRTRNDDVLTKHLKFEYHMYQNQGVYFLRSISQVFNSTQFASPIYHYNLIDQYTLEISGNESDQWGYFNDSGEDSEPEPIEMYVHISAVPQEGAKTATNHYNYIFSFDGAGNQPAIESILLEGAETVNPAKVIFGTLKGIEIPQGKYTQIDYELNTFLDSYSNLEEYGGGLRVKEIKQFETISDATLDVENLPYLPSVSSYEYKDINDNPSGRVVNKPLYAIPQAVYRDPTNGDVKTYDDLLEESGPLINLAYLFEHLTVRTSDNLSPENNFVLYSRVTEKYGGNGKRVYNYDVPNFQEIVSSVYYDNGSANLYQILADQNAPCEDSGTLLNGQSDNYLNRKTSNYNLLYGNLMSIETYNQNTLLDSVSFEYDIVNSDQLKSIPGIVIETFPGVNNTFHAVNKYQMFCNAINYKISTKVKKFDENGSGKFFEHSSSTIFDENINQITKELQTKGDKITQVEYKYPEEYEFTNPSSLNTSSPEYAIFKMNERGIKSPVIEEIVSVGNNVSQLTTVGGQLTEFSFNNEYILPKSNYSFKQIMENGLMISSINANDEMIKDDNYQLDSELSDFNKDRFLTSRDKFGTQNSHHLNYLNNSLLLEAENAKADDLVFTNFIDESYKMFDFNSDDTNDNGLVLIAGESVSREGYSIYSNDQLQFSVLVKPENNANLSLVIRNSSNSNQVFHSTKMVQVSNKPFEFVSWDVDLNGLSLSQIDLTLTSNQEIQLYEALLKPENAYTNTYLYDDYGLLTRITDNNGKVITRHYDQLRQLVMVKDQNGNILQKKDSSLPTLINLNADFSITGDLIPGGDIILKAADNLEGTEYFWKINGTSEVAGSSSKTISLFNSGFHYIQLKVEHEGYEPVTNVQYIKLN